MRRLASVDSKGIKCPLGLPNALRGETAVFRERLTRVILNANESPSSLKIYFDAKSGLLIQGTT
jgi:hypothetical protein